MGKLASLFIDKKQGSTHQHEKEERKPGPYRLLFVDDEQHVLSAMQRIFKREKYDIMTAGSGEDALKILKDNKVNLILSDHRMPGMSGADLLREVKRVYPETIRIMLTGYADVNAVMGAVNEGSVYKFITKPWNDEDLRLTVSLALEQYDLLQENIQLKKDKKEQNNKIKQCARLVNTHKSQIGTMLLKSGVLTESELKKAYSIQTNTKKILPVILADMGIADEDTIIKTIENETSINRVYPNEFTVPKILTSLIPKEICKNNLIVPLKKADGKLIVAMADPTDYVKIDDLRFITGLPIEPVISKRKDIEEKLTELYDDDIDDIESSLSEIEIIDPTETIEIILDDDEEDQNIEDLLRDTTQPPAIRIVNAIISDALRHQASDIHIEPKVKHTMVRYRIDGLLQDKIHIPLSMHMSIVSRIKVLCELDISERRKPQDGRVTVKTSSKMVDMRISTLPTIGGEKIVMRILDKNASIKDIKELGLSTHDLKKIINFVKQPQGMVLTTGPTGSGKTSTLYSLLNEGATITKNYTTIEDPVEYYMGIAEQVNVRSKIGLDFPMVLRAILRQDPNVIMLGEIRDYETAEVALNAALTGHLVFSTLHTNGSISTITRLRDMGIKPYVISEALSGIIAQRLVRRICMHCSIEYKPDDEILQSLKLDSKSLDFTPVVGKGCPKCNGTGYHGRIGLFEVFPVEGELKRMIHRDATESELLEAAKWAGMTTLFEDAISKVKSGLTTFDEVIRVLGVQNSFEIQCKTCGYSLEDKYRFCPKCGNTTTPRCKNCDKILGEDWIICPYCGLKR